MTRDKKSRGKLPSSPSKISTLQPATERTQNTSLKTLKFCLAHIQKGHCVRCLTDKQRADLALSIQQRCEMSWNQIILTPKHGLGTENMPANQIKPKIPECFGDREQFIVLRYSGNLPMVGVRIGDVFHVLWIEKHFGDVCDHS
jgi:hypothetical protein